VRDKEVLSIHHLRKALTLRRNHNMGAILLISGNELNVDQFNISWQLKPSTVHRKGEPVRKTRPEGEKKKASTIIYDISDADYSDLSAQIQEVTHFLRDNKHHLEKLEYDNTIESIAIDFAFNSRIDRVKVEVQHDYFPAEFVKLAGSLNIEIRLTQWPYDSIE